MRKSYTEADKLAAVFLAQQAGVEAAATALGIDPRSVRDWSKTITLPDDQWTAIRDVLIARGSVMAAKGTTTGLAATLTGAGIAERNVRYGQLIARREGRKADTDADTEAAEQRTRRRLIHDELWPQHWRMEAHHSPNAEDRETPEYLAAERFFWYMRAVFRHMRQRANDAEAAKRENDRWSAQAAQDRWTVEADRQDGDPIVPDAIGAAGSYLILRQAADFGTDEEAVAAVDRWDAPGIGAISTKGMADEGYRELIAKVVTLAQAEADAWWPQYLAVLHKGCIAERVGDGIRVLRDGVVVHDTRGNIPAGRGRLPYEWRGVPMIAAHVPDDARLVNAPQLEELIREGEQLLLETT